MKGRPIGVEWVEGYTQPCLQMLGWSLARSASGASPGIAVSEGLRKPTSARTSSGSDAVVGRPELLSTSVRCLQRRPSSAATALALEPLGRVLMQLKVWI